MDYSRSKDLDGRKAIVRAPSTRTRGSSSHQEPSFRNDLYETLAHSTRGESLKERKLLHEHTIKFPDNAEDTFKERIFARGWNFMYDPPVQINASWVREFYANITNSQQSEVFMRGKMIPFNYAAIQNVLRIPALDGEDEYRALCGACTRNELDLDKILRVIGKDGTTWWEDPTKPVIPSRIKNKIFNREVKLWQTLILCYMIPTRHETTMGMEQVLLIYTLMENKVMSLPAIMMTAMNDDPTTSKNLMLSFLMSIIKWAQKAKVPRYPEHEIVKISKYQQFFPFGKWRVGEEAVADFVPPPIPPPILSSAARVNIPTTSTARPLEPSRMELMRALKRNERIMRRHEQLLLQLHHGLDISGLEQISSPGVSQNQ
ncbi:hypothetical protein PIB30_080266 [Stylosanthes scabra]|uniref:Putative plant transposon protein domain-containing protein n=1 Tax=Stylosanthes scabra TaxID=79078 RepID=A0ABU6YU27_9FABA|nr:hypothetical protein [Stylosanthes scabra]